MNGGSGPVKRTCGPVGTLSPPENNELSSGTINSIKIGIRPAMVDRKDCSGAPAPAS